MFGFRLYWVNGICLGRCLLAVGAVQEAAGVRLGYTVVGAL
jgi:hypothetical protein